MAVLGDHKGTPLLVHPLQLESCYNRAIMTRKRTRSAPAPEPSSTWDETLIKTLLPLRIELAGIVLIVAGVLLLLGVSGLLPAALLNGIGSLAYQLFEIGRAHV